MKRFLTIFLAALLVAGLSFTALAADEQYRTSRYELTSYVGDNVTIFTGKSGLQTVIDNGVMVAGGDTDAALYVYYQGATTTATSAKAATATTVSLTTTSSSSVARTGDIIYEVTRADDPADSSLIFHGVITGHTFSDTANTDVITRTASNSAATLNTSDTVYVGIPIIGTRGTGATDLFVGDVLTDDNSAFIFGPNIGASAGTVAGAIGLANASTDSAYPNWIFPRGKFGLDYLIRFDAGSGSDGETIIINGHYEAKK